MHTAEELMTPQAPIDTPHGWLTLINRHSGERLQMRRIRRDGEMWLELQGTLPPNQDGPPLHIHFKEHEEGTLLGRYSGTDWPGCADRCQAGPLFT